MTAPTILGPAVSTEGQTLERAKRLAAELDAMRRRGVQLATDAARAEVEDFPADLVQTLRRASNLVLVAVERARASCRVDLDKVVRTGRML